MEELEGMMGLMEMCVMMFIAGDINEHVGIAETALEDSVEGFGS